MKGNDKMIAKLNELLAEELTAVNQYMVHAEMCDNWGYKKLHELAEKRAISEMKHAETLIGRILFLDGTPTVSKYNKMLIGADVELQHKNDVETEYGAVKSYNEGIAIAREVGDGGTRKILDSILKDEEDHVDALEAQLSQIEQMGIKIYLTEQIG